MKVYLKVSYDERFKAKALGCRWDMDVKCWYVVDPQDLEPFKKWLPSDIQAFYEAQSSKARQPKPAKVYKAKKPAKTGPKIFVPLCNCDVLPWEDCEHTDALADKAMRNILALG